MEKLIYQPFAGRADPSDVAQGAAHPGGRCTRREHAGMKVISPTKSSTYCSLLLIKTLS